MAVPIMANNIMTPIIPPMMLPVVGPFSGRRSSGKIVGKMALDKIEGQDFESSFNNRAVLFYFLHE